MSGPIEELSVAEDDGGEPESHVPTIDQLLRPVLDVLADGQTHELPAVVDAVANHLGLDAASRSARIRSGATVLENRVGWARTSLVRAGLIEQPRESAVAITDAGRKVLATETGLIDHAYLRDTCPGYAAWLADMGGELPQDEQERAELATVWMVRAGRGGAYAPTFVERSAVVVGWGSTGAIDGQTREEILDLVKLHYPALHASHRGQGANTLYRLAHTMREGDLVLTPEPATRTILLGRVSGPYRFLEQPIDGDVQHSREVTWFARAKRDELSYGARNSLGTLLTLTRPSYEPELLHLAESHSSDPVPKPLEQSIGRRQSQAIVQRVSIPAKPAILEGSARGEFQTVPRRLTHLLGDLDGGQLALPDFQRSFVWAPDATRELLVSMIRAFPAGALLFLQGGSATFKARAAEEAPALKTQPSYLVLDGQQRLTSLYQALYGVGQSRFFLDIGELISGADINDAVRVLSAERAAPLEPLEAQAGALMMPLSVIRDSGAGRWRDDVVDLRKDDDPSEVRALLRDVERTYIEPLVQYAFPVTVLPQETELEAVCTIFETLNRTGKPLTPFELISARAFAGGHSLYDYWSAAQQRYPVLTEYAVEPYYVLQVIALRLGVSCKRSSVLGMAADDIARLWDDAVADMAAAVSLLRDECGVLVSKWLPYRPMLIPLASAWREVATATGPEEGAIRLKLKRWFWCATFTGEYDSSSASLAERDAPALRRWLSGEEEPPVVADFAWDPQRWQTVTVRQQGLYRATIALTLAQRPRDFHTGVPLTHEVVEAQHVDDHHIFPRGYLTDIGRGSEVDSVLNHSLIDRATNTRIGKKAPSVYLGEIRAALEGELDKVLASHLLPFGQESPLAHDDFDAFLAWRLERFTDALTDQTGSLGSRPAAIDPHTAKLNARIDDAERKLREIIVVRLGGDDRAIPQHVSQKVDERIEASTAKSPGAAQEQHSSLAGKLEYFDLRDLQSVLTAKSLWQQFEATFGTKEHLNTRFSQLAELRNTIRHSRTLDAIIIKDGEAALLWFEKVFQGFDQAAAVA